MKKLSQFDEASVWEALKAVGFDIQDDDEPTDGVKIVTGDGSVTVLPSDFNLFDDPVEMMTKAEILSLNR